MIYRISDIVSNPRRDCIYDFLGHLSLGLCVDVGAAAGDVTRRISRAGGESTRVVAFEPFPGNHDYFYEITRGLGNVMLIKKAVSDYVGRAEFHVPSVVRGNESGWEDYAGYSSVGFLSFPITMNRRDAIGRRIARGMKSIVEKALGRPPVHVITVETTTIDREFDREKIDFMKIDVQGGECRVLIGSQNALQRQDIGIIYMEWSGDMRTVDRLTDNGYWLCDSTYVVGPRVDNVRPFEEMGFQFLEELQLSTGEVAYELLLRGKGLSPPEAMEEVKKRRLGWIQTDLIAVSDRALPSFLRAAERYQATGMRA